MALVTSVYGDRKATGTFLSGSERYCGITRDRNTGSHKLGGMRPFSGMTGYDGMLPGYNRRFQIPGQEAFCWILTVPAVRLPGRLTNTDMIYRMRERNLSGHWQMRKQPVRRPCCWRQPDVSLRLVTERPEWGSVVW